MGEIERRGKVGIMQGKSDTMKWWKWYGSTLEYRKKGKAWMGKQQALKKKEEPRYQEEGLQSSQRWLQKWQWLLVIWLKQKYFISKFDLYTNIVIMFFVISRIAVIAIYIPAFKFLFQSLFTLFLFALPMMMSPFSSHQIKKLRLDWAMHTEASLNETKYPFVDIAVMSEKASLQEMGRRAKARARHCTLLDNIWPLQQMLRQMQRRTWHLQAYSSAVKTKNK